MANLDRDYVYCGMLSFLVNLKLLSVDGFHLLFQAFDKRNILKESHTRQLLGMLKSARAAGGGYGAFTIEELKNELKTREHIPNKIEAKKIRQLKAKVRR